MATPYCLDAFWEFMIGRGFNASAGDDHTPADIAYWHWYNHATVATATSAGGLSVTVQAGEGAQFLVGEPIVIGDNAYSWKSHVVTGITGDAVSVCPVIDRVWPVTTTRVCRMFTNATHLGYPESLKAFAAWIAGATKHRFAPGANMVPSLWRAMETAHVDQGKAAVPDGWRCVQPATFDGDMIRANYSTSSVQPLARSGYAGYLLTVAGDAGGTGIETVEPIRVRPGVAYVASAMLYAAYSYNRNATLTVLDYDTGAVVATLDNAAGSATWGSGALAPRVYKAFVVPAGTYRVRLQILTTGTAGVKSVYADDVRLVPAMTAGATEEYVIDQNRVLLVGDSWGYNTTQYADAITNRLPGATVVNTCVAGRTISDMVAAWSTDLATARAAMGGLDPQIVVCVSCGMNDLAVLTAAEYATAYASLVSLVDGIGAVPVMLGSAPCTDASIGMTKSHDAADTTRDAVDAYYAAAVPRVAPRFGAYPFPDTVAPMENGMARRVPTFASPGRDGGAVGPAYLSPKRVGFSGVVATGPMNSTAVRDQLDDLHAELASGPRDLHIWDDRRYRGAVLDTFGESTVATGAARMANVTAQFVCPEPFAVGDDQLSYWTITGSGQTKSVTVGGTAPAAPVLEILIGGSGAVTLAAAITNTTTGEAFTLAGSVTGGDVIVVDCLARTVTIGGVDQIALFDGEFLTLAVGANTLSETYSSGTVTQVVVEWADRWY